jgi:hypothetical protein
VFRRSRFAKVVETQLDLFLREHADVLEEADLRLAAYNKAERDEAEERYGDYLDVVETGAEILAEMRDAYARTIDDPDEYVRTFDRAVARRLPAYPLDTERY